jgi:GT2 family glycosyltransferase
VRVSVLILTYNRFAISSHYIPSILDRIGNIESEVFIWDNGSNDGTFDWLKQLETADNRVTKVFGSEEKIGRASCRERV